MLQKKVERSVTLMQIQWMKELRDVGDSVEREITTFFSSSKVHVAGTYIVCWSDVIHARYRRRKMNREKKPIEIVMTMPKLGRYNYLLCFIRKSKTTIFVKRKRETKTIGEWGQITGTTCCSAVAKNRTWSARFARSGWIYKRLSK